MPKVNVDLDTGDFFQVETISEDSAVVWVGLFNSTNDKYTEIPVFRHQIDEMILALQEVGY